ncbi:hypothetical protein [Rubripirellula lacrimiformis]|nr:hypothetical protein [Rubripirellula lacrimiformis]
MSSCAMASPPSRSAHGCLIVGRSSRCRIVAVLVVAVLVVAVLVVAVLVGGGMHDVRLSITADSGVYRGGLGL